MGTKGIWKVLTSAMRLRRIRPGFTQAQAQQELTRLAALHTARYSKFGEWDVGIEPLASEITKGTRALIVLLISEERW